MKRTKKILVLLSIVLLVSSIIGCQSEEEKIEIAKIEASEVLEKYLYASIEIKDFEAYMANNKKMVDESRFKKKGWGTEKVLENREPYITDEYYDELFLKYNSSIYVYYTLMGEIKSEITELKYSYINYKNPEKIIIDYKLTVKKEFADPNKKYSDTYFGSHAGEDEGIPDSVVNSQAVLVKVDKKWLVNKITSFDHR